MFNIENTLLGRVNGGIDVTHRAVAQTPSHRIVLLPRHIGVHFAQQLKRLVQTARTIRCDIERRMIVQVLAVIDSRVPPARANIALRS